MSTDNLASMRRASLRNKLCLRADSRGRKARRDSEPLKTSFAPKVKWSLVHFYFSVCILSNYLYLTSCN